MAKLTQILAMALITAACQGQELRWRYREFNSPLLVGDIAISRVNNAGQMQVWASRTPTTHEPKIGILNVNGDLILAPQLNNRELTSRGGGITEDGSVYGFVGDHFAKWNPITGYATYPYGNGSQATMSMLMNSNGNGCLAIDLFPAYGQILYAFSLDSGIGELLGGGDYGNWMLSEINEGGFIAGQQMNRAVVWSPGGGSQRVLHNTQFENSLATGINNNGEILGFVEKSGPESGTYAYWWDTNGIVLRQRMIHPFSQASSGYVLQDAYSGQINDMGEITFTRGTQYSSDQRAFFYSPLTGEIDLNLNVDGLPEGTKITRISGLNNSRVMTGQLVRPSPTGHRYTYNFYLEPVPEPVTPVSLAVGLGLFFVRRKR